jgi:hypothetical protein
MAMAMATGSLAAPLKLATRRVQPTAGSAHSTKPSLSLYPKAGARCSFATAGRYRVRAAAGKLSVSANVGGLEGEETGEKGGLSESLRTPTSMAGIGSQLRGGGSAVMEKQGLSLGQVQSVSEAKTSDGDGGGNNGKNINNGGGGDGDDGDDDDYFDDDDEEGDDDNVFARRAFIPELFDRATIECVLQEWFKTLYSLPSGLRLAVEMGLVSSAQLCRFMSVDSRPSIIRTVARNTPGEFSRGFVGRLMGDPAILMKIAWEQALTVTLASFYEAQQRGDKLRSELDLAAVNVVGCMATNLAMVWLLCPNRTFQAPAKTAAARAINALPSNVFDRSGPLRQYSYLSRASGFAYKTAQLGAIGAGVGAATSAVSDLLVRMRPSSFKPALPTTDLATATVGMGANTGVTGNIRYQLLNGLDRYMMQTFNSLPLSLGVSALVRFGGQELGEQTRLQFMGLPKEAPSRRRVKKVVVKKTVKTVKKVKRSQAPSEDFSMSAGSRPRHH